MKFIIDGKQIEVKAVYSWFNVYVNQIMILHHVSREDADDIIKAIKSDNGKRIA